MKYLKKEKSKPMKRIIPIITAALLLVVMIVFLGDFGNKQEEQPEMEDAITLPSEMLQRSDLDVYADIIVRYNRAVEEQWDPGVCVENEISLMVGFLLDQNVAFGYTLHDLNLDGSMELIITDGNLIYDLYTIVDDVPVLLLSGMERLSYRLCDGDYIAEFGSGSAFYSVYRYQKLVADGSFSVCDEIVFDASVSEQAPWFDGIREVPLTEAEAKAVMDSYGQISIPFTSFAYDKSGAK